MYSLPRRAIQWRSIISLMLLLTMAYPINSYPVVAQTTDPLPTRAQLKPGWNKLDPGGETLCMDGSSFSFYVNPGTSSTDNLVIYFQGGGVCWDALTCDLEDSTAKTHVQVDLAQEVHYGIFDRDNLANPTRDFTFIVIAYCSGDLHGGNRLTTYTPPHAAPFMIPHRGAINARSVLAWVYANYASPATVLVTGSSAGSFGALFHAPDVMSHYQNTQVDHLGDGGVVRLPKGWAGWQQWGFFEALQPNYPELAHLTTDTFAYDMLFESAAKRFPKAVFSEYTTAIDQTQLFYYARLGYYPQDWLKEVEQSFVTLARNLPNYTSYVAGGTVHCILPRPEFYTYSEGDLSVQAWTTSIVRGQVPPSVRCVGQCLKPSLVTVP